VLGQAAQNFEVVLNRACKGTGRSTKAMHERDNSDRIALSALQEEGSRHSNTEIFSRDSPRLGH